LPKCGIKICPDDKTEKAYTILEPVMRRELRRDNLEM